MLAEQVRVALRDGLTIAAVQAKHPAATKRFVEEQRAFLRQTEGLARRHFWCDAGEVLAFREMA
jgi:hypothetical protein